MSGKRDKAIRRQIRKTAKRQQKKIIMDFLKTASMFSFKGRVKIALKVLFKRY